MGEKGTDPLPFENWIFRNGDGQQISDGDYRMCVSMTSTYEQCNLACVAFATAVWTLSRKSLYRAHYYIEKKYLSLIVLF